MRYDKVMAIITILLAMGIGESVISFRMGTIHGQRGADRYYAEHPKTIYDLLAHTIDHESPWTVECVCETEAAPQPKQ